MRAADGRVLLDSCRIGRANRHCIEHLESAGNEQPLTTFNKLRLARRKRGVEASAIDTPGISPTDIASHNSRAALEILRRSGPKTRLELSTALQLTEPAIAGIMSRLSDAGFVTQRKREGAGRYVSTEYVLKPESAFSAGIKWTAKGGTALLLDLAGSIVALEPFEREDQACQAVEALLSVEDRAGRCRGLAVVLSPELPPEAAARLTLPHGLLVRMIEDTEAAVIAERLLGSGEHDGGIVVIIVGDSVQAGVLIGGKLYKGEHGRAGNIGAMRTGPDRVRLDEVLSFGQYTAFLAGTKGDASTAIGKWADMAAAHLKDAIIAMGGFLSPGLILIGGELPVEALDALIARVNTQTREFIASFSVPELARTHFPDGGAAEGAAFSVFLGDILPDVARMAPRTA